MIYDYEGNKLTEQGNAVVKFLPYKMTQSSDTKKSLCLCAIKTEIADNKMPFASGYLFHELGSESKELYYGTTLENATSIGTPTFKPQSYNLAISPTDGRVIATRRGDRGALFVWDGVNTSVLFYGAELSPMGWLYNSGVDFFIDGNDVEHCIFAEYDGSGTDKGGFYVWKGTYPYTSESDWETVFHMDFGYSASGVVQPDTITHFHQVKRDPWTNTLYLTAGDLPNQLRWWYSTDYGDTWTLLTDNANNGWEEHVCRTINFIFTKDWVYWAVDHGTNHNLNKIARNAQTGLLDISTREKLADLPFAQGTNSICYTESPHGLWMFDRIDKGDEYIQYYGTGVKLQFYELDTGKLNDVGFLELTNNSWGGHRGKCYTNYTNGQENHPAMGFSEDTPCVFDIVGASNGIGTIFYEL